jgi:hypothetical protein
MSVVCCQVEVSVTSWSLVGRCSPECGVSECDLETSRMRRPKPTRAVKPWGKNKNKKKQTILSTTQNSLFLCLITTARGVLQSPF